MQGIFSGTTQTLLACVSSARSSCTFVTSTSKGYMNSVLLGVSAVLAPLHYLPVNRFELLFVLDINLIHVVRREIFATNSSVTFKADHPDARVILRPTTWAISISYRLRLPRYKVASPIVLESLT